MDARSPRDMTMTGPSRKVALIAGITGQDGSVLDFTFSDEHLNPTVADKLFKFAIPPGAEVVEAGQ